MSYLGEEIKKLGFGLMRLPHLDENTIDIEQTKKWSMNFLRQGLRISILRGHIREAKTQ